MRQKFKGATLLNLATISNCRCSDVPFMRGFPFTLLMKHRRALFHIRTLVTSTHTKETSIVPKKPTDLLFYFNWGFS